MVFQQLLLNRLVKNQKMKTLRQRSYSIKNLSACGGPEVCEDMVRQDALTPLSALLRECCAGFDVSSSPAVKGQKHTVEDVANEAVNLLWNLCESSSTAVSVFNKAGLLDVLLRCLQRHPQNMELGISAGSLWNLKNGLSSAQQSQTLTALATTLSHSLSLDAGELIPELWRAESARLSKETTSAAESDHTDERPGGHEAEEMEEDVRDEKMNGRKSNGKMSKTKNDISDLLPRDRLELREAKALLSAQQTSLEIIVNMCCSDEPSDDEWEEMSSSDESEMCADGMSDTNSSLFSPLCLSAELHTTLLNHNIPQQDEEFLEAVTSALRSLLQIMATKNIPQCMTPHQLMSFCEAATSCELVSVRVNALAILGITGSSLAKEKNTAETLQLIGNALLNIAMKDSNLVVCGEALDALFDVFADGDEAEKAGKNINLLSSLKALQPGFRAKLRKEGRGKYSPDQLCVLDNIRINLKRFISYLEDLQRK
ncbi:HEAT repeat-containing 3 [Labeo rohita]|uniref:HEAT repeat-containing 3 n=1 Tax=Labeo rohita TaxID=84645 RepID=A0A498M8I4_LABRO|nr:HEAT repeat-containing 3 [Labeo rohita]